MNVSEKRFNPLLLWILMIQVILGLLACEADQPTGESAAPVQTADAPTVAAGSEPKTLVFDWAHINFPDTAHRYQLQVDPDGNRYRYQFNPVEDADDIQGTNFSLTISVHLTDWINTAYRVAALDSNGRVVAVSSAVGLADSVLAEDAIGYFKADTPGYGHKFGYSISLSADGNTLAVGVIHENGGTSGVNGDEKNDGIPAIPASGAVYIFTRSSGAWCRQAYIKASNPDDSDYFGEAVALSADGNTLAVGATQEASSATGVNGDESNNDLEYAGAVYLFVRNGSDWSQQAYIKAGNPDAGGFFGSSVSLSADGGTLAVGAIREASSATGVNGDESNNDLEYAGAVYLFARNGGDWSRQAYIKASNTDSYDYFGRSVSLSADGNTLAVGADEEESNASGVNGEEGNNDMANAGAVYLFTRSDSAWSQQAYIKAGNTYSDCHFGYSVSLSADGDTLAVGAYGDLITGDAYLFTRSDSAWSQQARIRGRGTAQIDGFGCSVSLSADGNALAVGARYEYSNATGINGNAYYDTSRSAGAAYFFTRNGKLWRQQAYIKASNTGISDNFGSAVSLSGDGGTLAVGAPKEDSSAGGINGDDENDDMRYSGAVYLY